MGNMAANIYRDKQNSVEAKSVLEETNRERKELAMASRKKATNQRSSSPMRRDYITNKEIEAKSGETKVSVIPVDWDTFYRMSPENQARYLKRVSDIGGARTANIAAMLGGDAGKFQNRLRYLRKCSHDVGHLAKGNLSIEDANEWNAWLRKFGWSTGYVDIDRLKDYHSKMVTNATTKRIYNRDEFKKSRLIENLSYLIHESPQRTNIGKLAKLAGISHTTISNALNGIYTMTRSKLEKVAAVYGLTADDLLWSTTAELVNKIESATDAPTEEPVADTAEIKEAKAATEEGSALDKVDGISAPISEAETPEPEVAMKDDASTTEEPKKAEPLVFTKTLPVGSLGLDDDGSAREILRWLIDGARFFNLDHTVKLSITVEPDENK